MALNKTLNSKEPIKDYLDAVEEHQKMGSAYDIKPEDDERWYFLNDRIKQLAFIINHDPILQYKSKTGYFRLH